MGRKKKDKDEQLIPVLRQQPNREDVEMCRQEMLAVIAEYGVNTPEARRNYRRYVNVSHAFRSSVYFVQVVMPDGSGGPIKIGCSKDIKDRVYAMQCCNPFELKVLGSIYGYKDSETAWHNRFEVDCIRGEWFEPSKRLMGAIQEAIGC